MILELESSNWIVRTPIQLVMLGLRDPDVVGEGCDSNSREQVLRFLAWVAEEERAAEQAGDSMLFASGDKYERLLQALAWLALDRPTQGRDRNRAVLREHFSAEPTLSSVLAAADMLYAAGPDPAALLESAKRAADRGGVDCGGELVKRLADHVRVALEDPALARQRAKYNIEAITNLSKKPDEWLPPDRSLDLGFRQAKVLHETWKRIAELELAPDLAMLSDKRLCSGGAKFERAYFYDQASSQKALQPVVEGKAACMTFA